MGCCSDRAVGFHYVSPQMMYVMDFLIYRLRLPPGTAYLPRDDQQTTDLGFDQQTTELGFDKQTADFGEPTTDSGILSPKSTEELDTP